MSSSSFLNTQKGFDSSNVSLWLLTSSEYRPYLSRIDRYSSVSAHFQKQSNGNYHSQFISSDQRFDAAVCHRVQAEG